MLLRGTRDPAPGARSERPPLSVVGPHSIDQLEREIQQLRIEFERFFSGASATPPNDLRDAVQRRLRLLREANLKDAADQFRLNALEARFNSYNELFHRRLREHEEGRRVGARPAGEASGADAYRGVVVGALPSAEEAEALYTALYREADRAPSFDLETFRAYLGSQVERLRTKSGCSLVQFRISSEQGKAKLKAKPVGSGRS